MSVYVISSCKPIEFLYRGLRYVQNDDLGWYTVYLGYQKVGHIKNTFKLFYAETSEHRRSAPASLSEAIIDFPNLFYKIEVII